MKVLHFIWDNILALAGTAIGFGILAFIYQPLPFILGFLMFIAWLIKKSKEK